MSHVVKALVALAALAGAGYLVWTQLEKSSGGAGPGAKPPPVKREKPGDAPSSDRDRAAAHAEARAERRREVGALLNAFRYRDAVALVIRHGFPDGLLGDIREEQRQQVEARKREATALYEADRHVAALESLRTDMQLEQAYRTELEKFSIELERRIRTGGYTTPPPARPAKPEPATSLRAEPGPPPALPGLPHPDVKRLAEARDLLAKARQLFGARKYRPAARALGDLVGFYGDLRFVKGKRDAVVAMNALARHGAEGVGGLFHASSVKRRGKKVTLRYTFEGAEEFFDWEVLPTIPAGEDGEFLPARSGLRGLGAMACLLRASFQNDVEIRCTARPEALKTFGLVFCQDRLETRQLMWIVSNHWFVEGENYRKERPGHSILMFGKGVNNDVPVDSPEVGFIFRGATITKPELAAGGTCKLAFSLRGDTMAGRVVYRGRDGERSGKAVGDDGRGIERVRPGLIVLQNRVLFTDIVVEGRLHTDFEKRRVSELLDVAANLD